MNGYCHSVETFGTVDGPGIRYVLFMRGCGLRCAFCHNPDTWSGGGQKVTVAEVVADIGRYRRYYAAGGGLTVSGGEPLLQPDFTAALFQACREKGIHTALDTSGHCAAEAFEKVLPHTDLVMFSIKAVRPEKHRRLTGSCNQAVLANLRRAAAKLPVIVRYVVIPGVTDAESDLTELGELLRSLPVVPEVELLAYHTLGRDKWQKIGREYPLEGVPAATDADLAYAAKRLTGQGIAVIHAGEDGIEAVG